MTPVYSGGLVYEYSEEGSGYGLVTINGDSVTEGSDFGALETAFKNTPAPSGDGGYKSSGSASNCPASSDSWQVTDFSGTDLPAIPSGAEKYMTDGAGAGPGLTGDGSQNAGGASSGTATAGSGTVTTTAKPSSSSKGAASSLHVGEISYAPFIMTGVVAVFSLFGAALV
jgi:hypothetical protein